MRTKYFFKKNIRHPFLFLIFSLIIAFLSSLVTMIFKIDEIVYEANCQYYYDQQFGYDVTIELDSSNNNRFFSTSFLEGLKEESKNNIEDTISYFKLTMISNQKATNVYMLSNENINKIFGISLSENEAITSKGLTNGEFTFVDKDVTYSYQTIEIESVYFGNNYAIINHDLIKNIYKLPNDSILDNLCTSFFIKLKDTSTIYEFIDEVNSLYEESSSNVFIHKLDEVEAATITAVLVLTYSMEFGVSIILLFVLVIAFIARILNFYEDDMNKMKLLGDNKSYLVYLMHMGFTILLALPLGIGGCVLFEHIIGSSVYNNYNNTFYILPFMMYFGIVSIIVVLLGLAVKQRPRFSKLPVPKKRFGLYFTIFTVLAYITIWLYIFKDKNIISVLFPLMILVTAIFMLKFLIYLFGKNSSTSSFNLGALKQSARSKHFHNSSLIMLVCFLFVSLVNVVNSYKTTKEEEYRDFFKGDYIVYDVKGTAIRAFGTEFSIDKNVKTNDNECMDLLLGIPDLEVELVLGIDVEISKYTNYIHLSKAYEEVYGYEVGDEFVVELNGVKTTFIVNDFFETDLLFIGIYKFGYIESNLNYIGYGDIPTEKLSACTYFTLSMDDFYQIAFASELEKFEGFERFGVIVIVFLSLVLIENIRLYYLAIRRNVNNSLMLGMNRTKVAIHNLCVFVILSLSIGAISYCVTKALLPEVQRLGIFFDKYVDLTIISNGRIVLGIIFTILLSSISLIYFSFKILKDEELRPTIF